MESLAPAGDSQGPRGGPVGQAERRDVTAGGGPARPPSPAGRARPAASADELDDQENIDLEMSSLHLLVTLTGELLRVLRRPPKVKRQTKVKRVDKAKGQMWGQWDREVTGRALF